MQNSKKTKIIATMGPASEDPKILEQLFKEGVNVIRLNFSHGDYESHTKYIKTIREVAERLEYPIAILQDLSGPKIRTGDMDDGAVILKKGDKIVLTTKKMSGTSERIYINYPKLPQEVKKGSKILIDDGKIYLLVASVSKDEVVCKIIHGGVMTSRRGVSIPMADLSIETITAKDKKDLAFGVKHNIDFVALSFVRTAKDIRDLRKILKRHKSDAHVIAKIETSTALKNIDEIIVESDGVMVARGDLAVETPSEDVPLVQKNIVERCNVAGKSVIVATQMLESMVSAPVPTRAEISDVANAIIDGADAVMLSQETAVGKYPLEAVSIMAKVALKVEGKSYFKETLSDGTCFVPPAVKDNILVDAITSSSVYLADRVNAKVIVALTESGFTARMLCRYRPNMPVLALTKHTDRVNRMSLYFGCYPAKISNFTYIANAMEEIRSTILKKKLAKKGDRMVIVTSTPLVHEAGKSNVFFLDVV